MMKLRGKNLVAALMLTYIIAGPVLIPNAVPAQITESSLKSGPYVDKIRYDIITQDDQQVLALQDNTIDIIGDWVDPTFLETLQESNNIEVANMLRNGYGYININCEMYPYNITAFRRALAFALDKEYISENIWDGLSEPLDSCVPKINPWTIEGQLPYSYYNTNIPMGEHLLDTAGFLDIDSDGYRESPNGDELFVEVAVFYSSNIAMEIGENVAAALDSLNVNATWFPYDYYLCGPIPQKLLTSWYPIVFYSKSYSNFDVDWLATEFCSEYADNESVWNLPRFKNSTYDSWREQLLHSTDYGEVYEAAIEMQKIWVYECPQIICYENTQLTAHRTDRFEGFVNDARDGVPNWWSNYRAHLKDTSESPFGGTLRWSTPLDLDTFNFMTTHSVYTHDVLQMLYDSLLRVGPDGNDELWLAESYTIEIHKDNPSVTDGHTRLTFEILQNATWSDGEPLTAEDIAFTLDYYRYSGNIQGLDLSDMVAAYSLNPYTLRVEFDTESYWHLHSVGYKYILPQHIYSEIGKENWNKTNPQPPSETMVTSGPFNISNYVPEEYIELARNPNYFFDAISPWEITGSTIPSQEIPVEILVILAGASIAVVVIGIVVWKSKIVVID